MSNIYRKFHSKKELKTANYCDTCAFSLGEAISSGFTGGSLGSDVWVLMGYNLHFPSFELLKL